MERHPDLIGAVFFCVLRNFYGGIDEVAIAMGGNLVES